METQLKGTTPEKMFRVANGRAPCDFNLRREHPCVLESTGFKGDWSRRAPADSRPPGN